MTQIFLSKIIIYISETSVSERMFIELLFLVLVGTTTSQNILHFLTSYICEAKVDWDFRISDLIKKNPDGTDFNPCGNFGEVRRPQLAKYTVSPPRWGPWDLFRPFKVFSLLKRELGAENNGKLPHIHLKLNCNLGSWVCGGRSAFGQNCSLGAWPCSERPALGQNTYIYIYIYIHYMNDITIIMDDITWKNQEQGIN